jgi:hypothetical protein
MRRPIHRHSRCLSPVLSCVLRYPQQHKAVRQAARHATGRPNTKRRVKKCLNGIGATSPRSPLLGPQCGWCSMFSPLLRQSRWRLPSIGQRLTPRIAQRARLLAELGHPDHWIERLIIAPPVRKEDPPPIPPLPQPVAKSYVEDNVRRAETQSVSPSSGGCHCFTLAAPNLPVYYIFDNGMSGSRCATLLACR